MATKGREHIDHRAGGPGVSPGARSPSRARCRRMIRERLAGSLDAILKGFVAQAKKGGSQHMKTTAELLEPKGRQKPVRAVKGTAHRLLEEAEAWERSQRPDV